MLDAELRRRKFSRKYTKSPSTFIGGQRDDHWPCFKWQGYFTGASLSASAQAGRAMRGMPAAGGKQNILRKTRGRRSGTAARAEEIQTAESGGRELFLFRRRTIDCESNHDCPWLAGRELDTSCKWRSVGSYIHSTGNGRAIKVAIYYWFSPRISSPSAKRSDSRFQDTIPHV
jgi:hypothetical protein